MTSYERLLQLHVQDMNEETALTKRRAASDFNVPDATLLAHAVKNARSRRHNKRVKHPRWVAVMDIFALGSGYAMELCRRFDLDPDEEVSR